MTEDQRPVTYLISLANGQEVVLEFASQEDMISQLMACVDNARLYPNRIVVQQYTDVDDRRVWIDPAAVVMVRETAPASMPFVPRIDPSLDNLIKRTR